MIKNTSWNLRQSLTKCLTHQEATRVGSKHLQLGTCFQNNGSRTNLLIRCKACHKSDWHGYLAWEERQILERIQTQKLFQKLKIVKTFLSEHIYKLHLAFFMICSKGSALFSKWWKICSLLESETSQFPYKFFKQWMEIFSSLNGYIQVFFYPHTVFLTRLSLVPITQAGQGKWV